MWPFKPAWQKSNEQKALEDVAKENTQATLAIIAQKAPSIHVRVQAVTKLTDQTYLERIAQNDAERKVRMVAIEKLTNQIVLEQIAKDDPEIFARQCAVEKLTDTELLKSIAESDGNSCVRITAMTQLNDQALFASFAKNDLDNSVRQAAIRSLNDPACLSEIINNTIIKNKGVPSFDYALCIAAWERLTRLGVHIDNSIQEQIAKLNAEKCKREGHVWLYTTGYNGEKLRQTAPCQRCGYVDWDYRRSSGW